MGDRCYAPFCCLPFPGSPPRRFKRKPSRAGSRRSRRRRRSPSPTGPTRSPFSYVNERKQVDGFSIELCKRVVNSIERQLKIQPLKIDWVPVTVQSRFEAVAKGACGHGMRLEHHDPHADEGSGLLEHHLRRVDGAPRQDGIRPALALGHVRKDDRGRRRHDQRARPQRAAQAPPAQRDRDAVRLARRGARRARRQARPTPSRATGCSSSAR